MLFNCCSLHTLHCVIKLANVVMGAQLENVTFGNIEFHLPGNSPLSERIKILL